MWNEVQHDNKTFSELSKLERLLYLCTCGHLAPSTHNTQPWRFTVDEKNNEISIYCNKKRILPASDVVGRQTLISIGCCIKNIKLAASSLGLTTDITYNNLEKKEVVPTPNASESENISIANIVIDESNETTKQNSFIKHIFNRKVIRAEYDQSIPLGGGLTDQLLKIIPDEEIKLHLVTDHIRKQTIAEFQGQADNFVINSKKFSKELGEWLLPNNTNSGVGMPGNTFGLSNKQAQRIHEALMGISSLEPEDGLKFATAGKLGMEKASGIGFLTTKKDEPIFWVKAGEIFEEIFLTCNANGYQIAVHAGIAEVPLVNKMFAATLGTMRKIMLVFRIGKPKRPDDLNWPHSPREKIEKMIVSQS